MHICKQMLPSPNSTSIFSSASALDSVPAAKPASSSSAGPELVFAGMPVPLAFATAEGLFAMGAFVAAAGGLLACKFVFLTPSAFGPASAAAYRLTTECSMIANRSRAFVKHLNICT